MEQMSFRMKTREDEKESEGKALSKYNQVLASSNHVKNLPTHTLYLPADSFTVAWREEYEDDDDDYVIVIYET
jgi:hypothetical protein